MSMTEQQIAWIIVAVTMILFWILFSLAGSRKIESAGAIAVMEYGKGLRVLALIAALSPPTLLATLMWQLLWRNAERMAIAGGSLFLLSVFGGLLLIEIVRVRIVVTEDGITRYSPWTGTASVKWGDIRGVRWSPYNRWFVLRTGVATIRVSRSLEGIDTFAATLRRRVAAEHWVQVSEELNEVSQAQ
jgi:hypothetical protein